MPYSNFTIAKIKRSLGITLIEGQQFFSAIEPIEPSDYLTTALTEGLPIILAKGTEKARSELIITPILIEVRRILNRTISLFSGEEFNVDPSLDLTGVCDYIISKSPEQLELEAPVLFIVEAKKENLSGGIAQCIAEMVAAQKFNQTWERPIEPIYGCVTSGTAWKFLKLEGTTVTLDLTEYPLPPSNVIQGILCWIVGA